MSAAVNVTAMQAALAGVNTRLPADSPLLPLCVSLALDNDLTPDSFANQWDAFKYSQHLKGLDSSSLARFTAQLRDDRALAVKRRVKKEDGRRVESASAGGAYVTNGGSKRIYTHRDILEDDELLSGILGPTRVKREADDPHIDHLDVDDDGAGDDSHHASSNREERKEADIFTTPAPSRHRSALLPTTASSATSASLLPFPSLTPSTPASSLLFTPSAATPSTAASTYQSRANPSTVTVTFNPTLAPPSIPSPPEVEERDARVVDVEVLLSPGELSDLETSQPFRFMFAKDEAVKDHLSDRLDLLQSALLQSRPFLRLTQRMKEEAAVKDEPTPPTPAKPQDESKDAAMTDVPSADGKEEKEEKAPTPAPAKADPDVDLSDWDEVGLSSTSARSQQSVVVAGRVCVDATSDDSKLTLSTVALEGSLSLSACHRINMRLGALASYSLFPGQVLLAKGVNAHGTAMVVEELLTSAPAPRLSLSPSDVSRFNTVASPLVIVCAAGPFTAQENLSFQPLADLKDRVNELRADVLILQGPFVDIQHPQVRDGRVSAHGLTEDFWAQLLPELNPHTRVIVQPSTREAVHVPVFPQPPLDFARGRNVTCVSNPATVRINDVVVGMTTLDVLSQLVASHSVLMHGVAGKRLPHLASHLLHQQSYYPLFPPVGEEAVDYTHGWRWAMPVRPDVLLLPSALGRFVGEGERGEGEEEGEGDGGVIVNGGYLTKGNGGGTYAQLTVHPMSEEEMTRADEDGRVRNHLVQSRTRVDIIRI